MGKNIANRWLFKQMSSLMETINIRGVLQTDAPVIADIYNHYITRTIITFEVEAVSSMEIKKRIRDVQFSSLPWLVAEHQDDILGYAYAHKWKMRSAYRFSTEVTVYVSPDHLGQGIGFKLFSRLLNNLKTRGMHVAIGGIALPNDASVALHEKLGFVKVGQFREIGFKFDDWIDVEYWQRIL